jgi:hypothetical protein
MPKWIGGLFIKREENHDERGRAVLSEHQHFKE